MSGEMKNYELAYLFLPSLTEEEVLTRVNELTVLVEENGGVIRHVKESRKIRLAYPVKKEKVAYFGHTTFTLAPELLTSLEKKIKNKKILRFLLVEEEVGKRPSVLRVVPSRPVLPRQKVIPREEPKTEEKLDLEALDKKLEEILGK